MKAIKITLYTCGSLMIVAAIAGTIDYKAAQKNGSIKNLYKEEKPVVTNTHKEIDVEDYSRGEINRPKEPPPVATTKKHKKAVVKTEDIEEEIIAVKTEEVKVESMSEPKKKKKLSYRSYSRGPIREDREIKEPMEVNTIDSAEQKAWNY